jgi:MFS-type transporter involved in bile tolerance (Atg22 family)
LNNLVTELFTTILSPFIGWIVDFWSLQTAFFLSAVILVIDLVILIAIYMIAGRKK